MSTENTPHIILPVEGAREGLRRRAVSQTEKLSRSVARLTSCDAPCVEYADEVLYEKAVIDDLLFYQHCRATLERCLANESSTLHYRRQDGSVKTVSFQRLSLGRVSIQGFKAGRGGILPL